MGETDEETEALIDSPPAKPKNVFGTRHVLGVMGLLGMAIVFSMRASLSVAIVAMVNSSAIPHINESSPDTCPVPPANSSNANIKDGEFAWDENEQALILGSAFFGYLVTSLIAGRLGEVLGGKIVFGFGVFVPSVITLATPVLARTSTTLLVVARVALGLGEGLTLPSMNALIARWVPPLERTKISSLVFAGGEFGMVVALPISGLLCQSTFFGGWPSSFYVFGVLGLIWCLPWSCLVYSDPEKHPRISLDEKLYIQHSLQLGNSGKKPTIPLRSVVTSMPFWAVVVAHFAENWGFYTLVTELPTYMKNILHFDIASNSFVSTLPYLAMWLFSFVVGQLSDYLRSSGVLSTTATRRLFNSIGCYGPMVCLILVGFAGCNKILAIVLLCIGVGLNGGVYGGFLCSHLDIAPNFAGTLMGLTSCPATIPGFIAPVVVGALINGTQTVGQWRMVFVLTAIVYFAGNTFYIIFVSGEVQPWSSSIGTYSSSRAQQGESGGQSPGKYQTYAALEETLRR